MTGPRGYVIYDGPSLLTGEPIVCVATLHSVNGKTGDMVQTWVLCADDDPVASNRHGHDRAICGDCPARGVGGKKRSCYVQLARAPLGIWGAWKRGMYPRAIGHAAIAAIGRGRKVRLGAYGDPAAMPSYVNESLLSACRANTAYSHQSNWQGPTGFNAAYMMVSVDSLAAAEAAWQRGERTFRVVGSLADMVKGQEAPCPASAEMRAKLGKHIQCVDCMLCGGQKVDAKSMVIPVHGAGRKHHTAAAG